MTKKATSITIEKTLEKEGRTQAKKEHRSFSSLIEYLLDSYLKDKSVRRGK